MIMIKRKKNSDLEVAHPHSGFSSTNPSGVEI